MKYIKDVLKLANGNKAEAGRMLGVSRQAIHQANENAKIPLIQIFIAEKNTGWSLSEMRPDIYPPERLGGK